MRLMSSLAAALLAVLMLSVPARALTINWDAPPAPMPALAMETRDGGEVDLDSFAGEIVVLNLWATWCGPCRVEMPTLAALQSALPDEVRVVALALDRADFPALDSFMDEVEAQNLLVLRDASAASARALGAAGLPVTIVIDREGRERFRHAGYADWGAPEVVAELRDLAAR